MNPTLGQVRAALKRAPVAILLVALLVRLAVLFATRMYATTTPYESNNIARAIASGAGFANPYGCVTGGTGHLAPVYPAFSALLLLLTGPAFWGIAKSLCSLAAVSAVWALMPSASTLLGFGRLAGTIAGFTGALLPLARDTELRGDWENPYVALALILGTIGAVRLARSRLPGFGRTALHGGYWGVLLLTIPSAVLIFPVWAYRVCRGRWRRSVPYLITVVAAAAVCIAPYVAYSRMQVGHWFFIRDNFGLELLVSNHPTSALTMMDNGPLAMAQFHPLTSPKACEEVQRLGEGQFNRVYLRSAVDFIRANPALFLRRVVQRAAWLIAPWTAEIKRNAPEWLVSALAIAGCLLLLRHRRASTLWLLCGMALYASPYLLVQMTPRYRYPVWWVFVLFTGYLLRSLVRWFNRHRIGREAYTDADLVSQ